MRVAACLDQPFPPNGHGQGWSLGWTTGVWLACILSAGAHRRSRVEPWVTEQQRTLRRGLGRKVKARDRAEDRFATIRDSFCVAARWVAFARALHQSVLRVYALQGRVVRVDPTTAAADVTPDGMCHLGPSQAHRPDLPQVQVAMAVRAPLGLPWTTPVVAGNTADAPLELPASARVRQSAGSPGLPDVGDGKRAAIGTRAAIVAPRDDSWCPLSATPRSEADLACVLAPVLSGALEPRARRLPTADGARAGTDEPVAIGVESTVVRSAPEHSGQPRTGPERRLVVRSLAWAARQAKRLRQRVAHAVPASNALDERQQGKPRVPDEAAASQAAAAVLANHRVEGLGQVTVTTAVHTPGNRRYGTRPAPTVRRERSRGRAASAEAPRAHAVQCLGWRVYAPKHSAEAGGLTQGVAAYRGASLIAPGVGRLQGRSLSLTPLCVPDDHRVVGLRCLLRIARRVLVVMQCGVRRNLQTVGATRKGL
jgi:transposase